MVNPDLRGFTRRWLSRRRRATLAGGVALGAVLVTAATLAGTVGLDPLPGRDSADRAGPVASPDAGPLRAAQPELGRTLLGHDDLPPGYSAGPAAADPSPAAPAGGDPGTPGQPAPSDGVRTTVPDLLLPNGALPGPLPGGALPGPFGTPLEGAPLVGSALADVIGGRATASPGPDGGHSPEATGGAPARPATAAAPRLCPWLAAAPWALAVSGARPVVTPRAVDHHDVRRGIRLRHIVGAFAGTGAADAVRRIRTVGTGCAGTAIPAPAPPGTGRQPRDASGRPARVTVRPHPHPHPQSPGGAPDEAYTVVLTGTGTGGRAWTGHLAVDRVGPVLSMLWHVGPQGALSPSETAAARRAAVDKARPLADRLD